MRYVIAIPTFRRSKVIKGKTLKILKDIPKKNKYIFIVEDEINDYEYLKDEVNIVIGVEGLCNQRKFIKNYFNEEQYIINMDDNIDGLYEVINEKRLCEYNNLEELFKRGYDLMKQNGLKIWGLYPVFNPYYMYKNDEYSMDFKYIMGGIYGEINDTNLEVTNSIKEDYERTFLHYDKYDGMIRFNRITCKRRLNYKGMVDEEREVVEKLLGEYPKYINKIFYRKSKKRWDIKLWKVPKEVKDDNICGGWESLKKYNIPIRELRNNICNSI